MVRKVATPARSSVVTLDPALARPKNRSSGDPFAPASPGAAAAFSLPLPVFRLAVPAARHLSPCQIPQLRNGYAALAIRTSRFSTSAGRF
jgi:hypothetical protein